MGSKKYVVDLTEAERSQCEQLLKKGKNSAEQVQRARILLKSDVGGANWKDKEIAEALDCSVSTVEKIRQRFVERGFEQALYRKRPKKPSQSRLLDGDQEAQIIAMRCGEPPAGYGQWSLRLLSKTVVERKICEHVSHETIRKTLKKIKLPNRKRSIG